jgi:hypothetical protein
LTGGLMLSQILIPACTTRPDRENPAGSGYTQ